MSATDPPGIVIIDRKIDPAELARMVNRYFADMVKYVVDERRNLAAVGGEFHADAGSRQEDLWGANYYPGLGKDMGLLEILPTITVSASANPHGYWVTSNASRKYVSSPIQSVAGIDTKICWHA